MHSSRQPEPWSNQQCTENLEYIPVIMSRVLLDFAGVWCGRPILKGATRLGPEEFVLFFQEGAAEDSALRIPQGSSLWEKFLSGKFQELLCYF